MLTDRINGNPIELGAKNKIISELGDFYGIDTPLNNLIVLLLGDTNKTARNMVNYSYKNDR